MTSRHPLLRALAIYREMPWRFTLVTTLYIAGNLGLAWQQWLIGHAVDDVGAGRAVTRLADGSLDASLGWHWLWTLLAIALGRGLLQYAAAVLSLVLSQALLTRLRERILEQVQALHLGYHWHHGMGELVTRTTRDADKVRDALITFWRQIVETPLVVLAAVGLLGWYDPLLGLVPLLLTGAGLWLFVRQTGRLVSLDRAVAGAYDQVSQELAEGIGGVRVIKAFGLEDRRIARFAEQVTLFSGHARAALAYASSRIPLPQAVVALGHAWILVYGAHQVAAGRLGIGELVTSLLVATTLVFRIEGIGRVMQTFADARASAERIWQLLDERPAVVSGPSALPAGPLGLKLDQVRVVTPGADRDLLHGCSLHLRPGEVVALVGATGSGKSLLASLLPRLTEADGGSVRVGSDRAGWHDVRDLDLAALRRRVQVLPQESFLFSDSLAANLRLAAPHASDGELREALRLAAAEDVLERLPHGLDTPLGDRGVTLSGGQRQRLCLARALLGAPDILCLDDATSALDAQSERRVLDSLRRLRGDQRRAPTLLLITSRLSTLLLADRVLLLDGGRISASASHAELATHNALYRDLLGIEHG
ncbi:MULTISPECIES: ABC transporter ATP-binding protein [unclassified Pseudomonas]|uniref:ABC transporter ATP-binding protein n=1 Tax=unclassified Pseudomonas TaxID=196821 RepID=UPI0024478C98|nr:MULTISPECIES: ABC transporter ATP-binding protein [unclassified Pseudomonas]MDH0303722.1 ABC transporter ATP-binding protein/permease [Pseudomonas sp. GD04091]MDH1988260.1 ABC transporter ATP-binding protein/permease [Pseudomonas sp. GD03689]